MGYMAWDDSLSIDVAMFDNEHKGFIKIVNDLYDTFMRGAPRYDLERICDRLIDHVVQHFRHEEMYFEDWQYPDRVQHTASHRQLRRQLVDYREQILAAPPPEEAAELFAKLKTWLIQHIVNEDRKYGAFLVERGLR